MTNHDMEGCIRKAVDHAVPDQWDQILSACQQEKGTVISMTSKKNRRWLIPLASAAALALIVTGVFTLTRRNQPATADSLVTLDINPSIALSVSTDETVLDVNPLNQDAQEVLGGMELKGTNLETAVNALIGACLQKGYLDDLQNAILVSVENQDAAKATQLQAQLTDTISGAFQNGSILTQNLTVNSDLTALAQQYGISTGKASLIQEVIAQDTTLSFESLAPLSVSEISLIASSRNLAVTGVSQTGSTSDQAYIGQDAALSAACSHAGVSSGNVQGLSMEFDSEKGIMVYELEFCVSGTEYDYEVNALDGSVVRYSSEPCDHTWHDNAGSGNGNGNTGTSSGTATGYIGESAAITAALNHAQVAQSNAQSMTVKLDYDDGVSCYEIEFCYNGQEYDYEVNATTGTIVKYETDTCDHYAHYNHGGNTAAGSGNGTGNGAGISGNGSGNSNTGHIGYDAALSAACSHAGLSTSQVTRVECELDYDDGYTYYEVSFHSGNMEYEFEIDAFTGAILKYESEHDD